MDNFTPLRAGKKKKKKISRFLLIANIFLMIFVVGLTGYYLRGRYLETQKPKAGGAFPHWEGPVPNNPISEVGGGTFVGGGICDNQVAEGCVVECTDSGKHEAMGFLSNCIGGGGGGGTDICPAGTVKSCNVSQPTCNRCADQKLWMGNTQSGCIDFGCGAAGTWTGEVWNSTGRVETGCGTYACIPDDNDVTQCGYPWNTTCYQCSCLPLVVDVPTATPVPPTNTPVPTTPANSPTPTPLPTSTPTPTGVISNTPTPTVTPPISNTPGPSATPIPVLCGTKSCDNATNPCRDNYICIQANDGSNYCSSPDFQAACKANPSYNSCCTAPGAPTATPTEIIVAQVSPTIAKLLQTGVGKSFMYLIPAIIMLVGLIL